MRGLNCPNKRGMLVGCFVILDVILLFFKNLRWKKSIVVFSLWGLCSMNWLVLPSVGHAGGIIVIWDAQVLELVDSKVGTYAVCIKFKSLTDDFVWGLVGIVQMPII